MRISVFTSKELQAVLATTKQLPAEVSKQVNKYTRNVAEPVWQQEVAEKASTKLERAVIGQTARVTVQRSNVRLRAGHIGRSLSGGAKPSQIVKSVEYGAANKTSSYVAHSRKGKSFRVDNRHTRKQFRPNKRGGYVAYPAAQQSIPRLAALWVQTVVKTTAEAFEKR